MNMIRTQQIALRTQQVTKLRWLKQMKLRNLCTKEGAAEAAKPAEAAKAAETAKAVEPATSWWSSAQFWGAAGAIAGWGMTGAAIYDGMNNGPEIISLNMTGVMLVYSSLFARWAWVVKPQNLLLCGCHVSNVLAQSNQMRRAIEHKLANGEDEQVKAIGMNAGATAAVLAGCVVAGPTMQSALVAANMGPISAVAAAEAGPFTVHFWAPMSKWLISGASMLDINRPTDKISVAQYTALTATGAVFSRYALAVTPVNYMLCAVNIALFLSSGWMLGRKVKADYM